jgi:hypothetical protein
MAGFGLVCGEGYAALRFMAAGMASGSSSDTSNPVISFASI